MRGGMWKRPLDHGLLENWLARALDLADAGGAAQARALSPRRSWEDDAEPADRRSPLPSDSTIRCCCPTPTGPGRERRSSSLDFHEADRWAQTPLRAPRSPDRSGQDRPHPVLRSDGRARRRPAGRGRDARAQARHRRLAAEHAPRGARARRPPLRRGGARTLGRGAPASAPHRAGRRRATRARRACSIRGRFLVCRRVRASSVSTPRRSDSRRPRSSRASKTAASAIWLDPPPAHLALLRGDLERVDALLESSGETWRWSLDGSLYALRDEARCADRARPAGRGRGGRDPPSRAGDVSRAVRAPRTSVAFGATAP